MTVRSKATLHQWCYRIPTWVVHQRWSCSAHMAVGTPRRQSTSHVGMR